jgi:hypothetical protein
MIAAALGSLRVSIWRRVEGVALRSLGLLR